MDYMGFQLLLLAAIVALGSGHGHMTIPRSRNWIAREEGTTGSIAGVPPVEYCPNCLRTNTNICGNSDTYNYDDWLDSEGIPMEWHSQAVYAEGEKITISFKITAHHGGHIEMKACNLGRDSTQSCLDQHPLTFVQDVLYGMPADPSYPERGYLHGWKSGVVTSDFSMEFLLPKDLVGDNVLLSFRYITANSCLHPGYESYYNGGNADGAVLSNDFWNSNLGYCDTPLPESGSLDGGSFPEQFFNCAEITITTGGSVPGSPLVSSSPSSSPPVPTKYPTVAAASDRNNRMIAYLGNWQSCPTAAQLAQYTHVVIAFAVSYVWNPSKNICSETCDIATPSVCSNSPNQSLIDELHAAGKKILLSFGGAGMGGSWAGDVNDCWEYCFGRETQVVNRLTDIVVEMDLDGVDIDYEYFHEDNQNGSGFTRGDEAQHFLLEVTTGLRASLPAGSIVTHAPMDADLLPGKGYYNVISQIKDSLDFIMPQYYNGVVRPVSGGFAAIGEGSISALNHMGALVDLFDSDATAVVFGFCVAGCTGSTSGQQAYSVVDEMQNYFPCHGGVFFWVAEGDAGAAWSSAVNAAMSDEGCTDSTYAPSSAVLPTRSPVATMIPTPSTQYPVALSAPPTKAPVLPTPSQAGSPMSTPSTASICGLEWDSCVHDHNSCCNPDYFCEVVDAYTARCRPVSGGSCLPAWEPCLGNEQACCQGLTCVGNENWKSCR